MRNQAMRESSDAANFNPPPEPWGEIVFSAADGFVWASWPGTLATVNLGRYDAVLAMMQDFVGQSAVAKSLLRPVSSDPVP